MLPCKKNVKKCKTPLDNSWVSSSRIHPRYSGRTFAVGEVRLSANVKGVSQEALCGVGMQVWSESLIKEKC